jgi:hypothetical protein
MSRGVYFLLNDVAIAKEEKKESNFLAHPEKWEKGMSIKLSRFQCLQRMYIKV